MDAAFFQTELISMGVALSELALKGTATMISAKMRSIKDEKNIDAVKNTYNEIVNELLQERDEAVRIAQTYKSELERVVISDEDIVHLHNTISTLIDIVKSTQLSSTAGREELGNEKTLKQIESYEKIKELMELATKSAEKTATQIHKSRPTKYTIFGHGNA